MTRIVSEWMCHIVVAFALAPSVFVVPSWAAADTGYQFVFGFKTRHDLDASPVGSYNLVSGLYTRPGFAGVQVTRPDGQSMGTEIPLGVVTLQ